MASAAANEGAQLLNMGLVPDAVKAFTQGVEANPKDDASLLGLARAHLALGHRAEAESALKKLVELRPEHLEAHSHLAALQLAGGDEKGLEKLKKIAAFPEAAFFEHYNLAEALMEREDWEGAEAALDNALKKVEGRHAVALVEVGRLALRRGDAHKAVSSLQAAVKLVPREVVPKVLLSRAHAARGELGLAINVAGEALKLEPKNPTVLEDLYKLNIAGGAPGAAAKRATDLRSLAPDNVNYMYWHGLALLVAGNAKDARPILAEVVNREPESVDASRALAQAMELEGDVEGARKLLEGVVAKAPKDAEAANDVATLYFKQEGGKAKARSVLEAALAANPEHLGLHLNLAIALKDANKGGAIQHARKAMESQDKDIRAQAEKLLKALGAGT